MKLKEALELGNDCGLGSVEECVRNVELHALSLFKYEDIEKEIAELYEDVGQFNKECSSPSTLNYGDMEKNCATCEHSDCGVCEFAGEISSDYVCDKWERR